MLAFWGAILVVASCQDLTGPSGLRGVVDISYKGPPNPKPGTDTVQATIGDTLAPPFEVTLSGIAQTRARYVYSTPAASSVMEIIANGDRVVIKGRGSDTLYATLLGASIGSDSTYRAFIVVNASPKTNDIDSTAVTFNAFGVAKLLKAQSSDTHGNPIPLLTGSVIWTSDDTTIATVQKTTTDSARVTSIRNGVTKIRALFDNIAMDSTVVTVQQTLKRYRLSAAPNITGGGQITLSSLNDTITVKATPVDANDSTLQVGSLAPLPPVFNSTLPAKASAVAATGLITAIANTDLNQPARVYVTVGGQADKTDTISFIVQQIATNITIIGKRVDTIQSIGGSKSLSAIMKDARGNDVQLAPSWTSSNPAVAQYQLLTSGDAAVAIDTGTVFVKVTRDLVKDSIVLVVRNDPANITLKPDTLLMRNVNDTTPFASANVTNTKGDLLTSGVTRTWTSLNPAVASVDNIGRVAANAVGTTGIVVSTNGKADTSLVIVTNFPASVSITTPPPTIASIGDSVFIGTALANGRGAALTANNSIVSWTSSNSAVRPRIDGSGWVYADGPGQAIVRATSRGDTLVRAEVIVTVSNATTNVTVSPAAPAALTSLGDQISFSATAFNSKGDPVSNPTLRWSVPVGSAFISIDSITGVATATANGTATVRATVIQASGNVTKDVSVTVGQVYSAAQSTITPAAGSLVANGTANTIVTYQLKDARGNALTFGGATLFPNTSRGTLSAVTDNGNGNYTATLTAGTTTGSAILTSAVQGAPAIANTGTVSFNPGVAAQYLLTVSPSLAPIAGAIVTVSARLADVNSNTIATAGNVVTWSSTGGGSFGSPTSTTDATGLATVTFTTNTSVSQHAVTATTGAITGTTNPPINPVSGIGTNYLVTPATTSPIAGSGVTVAAQLRDANSNSVALAGQTVTWSKSDANGSFSAPTSLTNASGVATVTFTSHTVSGTATTLTATTGGNTGTTATLTTVPGPASAAQTLITSSAPTVVAGGSVTITIQARDANGNNLSTSADATTLSTTRGVVTGTTSAGSGTYTATLSTTSAGSALVTGTINNQSITDNETVTITVGGPSAPLSTANVPAGTSGTLTTVVIQAKDAFGNNLTAGGSTVLVSVTGANTIASFGAVDNGNGTFTATYTPSVAGTDALAITLGGVAIVGSPYSSVVGAGALNHFELGEPPSGGAIGTKTAGTSFNIRVTAKDAANNTIQSFTGTTTITSSGALSTGGGATAAFTNGVLLSHAVTISNTGTFDITATNGSTGTSNSFTVVAGAANAAQSTASVPAGTAGAITSIAIQAKDANGNNRASTSGALVVSVTGSNTATASVADNLDGTYTATYTPTVAGSDNIAITLGGSPINGSPFTSTVAVGALHHFNIATIASQTAGTSFSATITAKDANNNTVAAFVGTTGITSSGTLTGAPVTSGAFTAGVRTETGLTITNVGSFTITATRSGGSEAGTSNAFAVAVGGSSAATSTASVPNGTAGSLTSITIQAKDANGNNRITGGDAVVVSVTGANIASAGVTDIGNGTYSASYTPTVAGTDNIAITLGGNPISGSSFASTVSPATMHHFAVTAVGGAPIGGQVAGTSFNIRIVAQDANNNTVPGFAGTVDLTSTGALTGAPLTSSAFSAGVLASQAVTITNTSTFAITATRTTGGTQTGTSNGFIVAPGAAVALQSTASVPSGTSSLVTTITVQARDANNNNRTSSSGAVIVSITGANTATASVTDNLNGTYTATYTPTIAGTDNIAITLGGSAISGSPFTSTVSPSSLHHFAVTNTIGGAIGSQIAGTPFNIMVVAQDASNNTVPSFTGTVDLTSNGTLTSAPITTPAFTGGVLASQAATITNTGSFTITATRTTGGAQTGASNSFTVGAGAAVAGTTVATVPAGTAGALTSISIQAKDASGNNLTAGGSTIVVSVTGANTATPTVTDNGNGTYSASYTPTVSGTDNVAITLGGIAISGSPYASVVSPGAVANFLVEAAGGGAIATQAAGGSFNIQLTARDANNNTVTAFTGAGNTAQISSSGTLSAGNGTTATFVAGVLASHAVTITNTGSFTITATRTAGTQTGTSAPFTVSPGAAAAAQTVASVPAGTGGSITTITVQTKDQFGNNLTTGGSTVVVTVSGGNTAGPTGATDNGNGTYSASYTPASGGTDAVSITLGGTPIGGSPYSSVVGAGTLDHFQVDAQGGGAIGSQVAGTPFNIRVIAQDANNNTVPSYTGTVVLTSTGALTGTPVTSASFVNGVLTSEAVTITNTGNFTITATGNSKLGTSNAFTVGAGAASASASTASVPAGTAGALTTILIQAKDGNTPANNRSSTSGTVVVSVTGANTATASITDNLNGTYTATYTPTVAGTDNVNITLGGVAINGGASPSYTSAVAVGALHHFNIASVGSQVAGIAFPIAITAKDANNNTVTGFGGTVSISSTGALSGGTFTSSAFTAGVLASENVTVNNTGSFTLTTTKPVTLETGTSNTFAVAAGLVVAGQSTGNVPSGIAGSLTTITVQAKDGNNNNRTSGGDAVVVTVTGANTATPSVTDNGNGTYSASYTPTVSGSDNVAITLGGTPISGSTFTSSVAPATLHHFAISTTSDLPIGTQAAGSSFNIKVVAQDANNNTVTGFVGTVALTSTGALTGAPVTTAVFTSGVLASQAVTVTNTGSFTITATRSAGGVQTGTSNTFLVTSGAATALFLAQQPSAAPTAGVAFSQQPVVYVRDASNNVVTSDNTTIVTAARLGGTGTLLGTTSITAVNGVATFTNLAHDSANAITIQFTAGVLTSATSNTVTVAPAALDHFRIATVAGQTAGNSFSIDLTAQDAFNNTVTSFSGTVQLTSSGTLTGAPVTSGAFVGGLRTQAGLTITNTGSFTLTASGGGKTGTSNSFAVTAGAATQLAIITAPTANPQSGIVFPTQPQVQLRDGSNNPVLTAGINVQVTMPVGGGTLNGTTTVATDASGIAVFTNVSITGTVGARTLRFGSPTVAGTTVGTQDASVTLAAGAATQLVLTTQPSAAPTAGISFTQQPVIAIRDAAGNTVLTDNSTIVTAARNAGSGALQGTLTATAVNGVATFSNLSHSVATTITIDFTVGGLTTATSGNVVVAPGAASSLSILTQPAGAVSGASFTTQPVVRILDAFGNLTTSTATVTAARSAGTASLQGTVSVAAVLGTATFTNLSYNVAEAVSIQFTSGSLTPATSNALTVAAGAATQLVLTTPPSANPQDSVAFLPQPVIQLRDAQGNSVASSGVSVAAAITAGGGSLAGTTSVVTDVNGTATFTNLAIRGTIGSRTLTFTSGGVSSTTANVTLVAGALNHFAVEYEGGGGISSQAAGTAFNVRVVAHDTHDNTVTTYTGASTSVDLTSSGTLTGTTVATGNFTNGVKAITAVTITNVGSFTITATKPSTLETGTSNAFTVTVGAASANNSTATVPAGTAGLVTTITVQAKDGNTPANNRTSTSGAVVVSITGANTATASVTDNLDGTYTATYTPTIAGLDNVTITLGGVKINGGATPSYTSTVGVGTLSNFLVEQTGGGVIGSKVAGTPFNIRITARDAGGNTVTGFGGTVSISSTGTLSAGTFTSASFTSGVLTSQAVTINNTGSFTITATNGQAGTSNTFSVAPGATAAAQSTASVPSTGTAGSLTSITIQAKDVHGNNRTTGGDAFVVSVSNANTASASVTDNSNGTYTATYTPTAAGTDNIAITLGGTPITGSTFSSTIGAATLHHFAVTNTSNLPIGSQAAGTSFNIKVVAQDANNNTVTGFTGTVDISATGTLNLGSGTTASFTSGVLATHSVRFTNTGSFTITATLTSGAPTGSSNAFLVQSGAATALFLAQTPSSGATAGVAFAQQPVVYVRDANNNVVTNDNTTVVTASAASGSGTLQGTTSVTAVNGVATFTNLNHTVANPITIQFTAGGLSTATSGTVTVASAALDHFAFAVVGSQVAGIAFSATITAQDAFNNTVTSYTGAGNTAVITTTGTPNAQGTTGNFASGIYTPHSVTITNTGSFTLTATGGGKTGTSNSFAVAVGAVNAAASTATVPAGTAGSLTTIVVQAKDAAGNNRTTGGSTVVVTITGSNPQSPSVTDNGNGTYTATYTPLVSGSDNVAITLGATPIGGSPYTSVVSPGALSQFTFAAIGSQAAGTSFNVAITARDANSNIVTGFTGTAVLTSTGALTGSPLTSGAFVGGVRASQAVTITNTGSFTLTATRSAGTEAGTSASFSVAAGAANAAQSTASVPAGTAGAVTTMTVQAKDAQGNNRTTTSGTVAATVTGANAGATVNVVNNANGTYTLTYTPTVSGTDAIAVTLDTGTPTAIGGSPYSSVVSPGALANYLVEAAGGGAIPTQTAGASFSIRLTARDASGNTVTAFSGGANTVDLTSTGTLVGGPTITTTAFINGVLTRSVTITNTGSITITATQTVGGTPSTASASFTVSPAGASGATTLITPSLASVTAGSPATITVQAKDANSNNLTTSGGTVTLATDLGTLSGVTNNNNGTYTATLSTSASGTATVTGTINGVAITDNAVVTVTVGAAATATSTVTAGSTSITANGASTSTITVQLKDAQGNNLTTGGATVVISTNAGTFTGATVDVGNGTYTRVLQSATSTATATLTATLTGNPIADDATVTFVAGAADRTVSTITSSPASPATVTVGTAVTITVQLKDANGNNLTASGGTVVISRSGTGSLTSTTNNGDGTYTATLNSSVVGSATVSATLGGLGITTGNPSVTFQAGAATQIAVNAGNNQSATAGSTLSTPPSVVVRDANGNPKSGVSVDFTVTAGLGTIVPASVATVATGTDGIAALTSWTLGTTAGVNTVTAAATGLTGSPVTFTATGTVGAGSAATSTVTSNQAARTAGQTATITIQLKDANSNNLTASGGTVTVASNIGTLSAVTNVGDGTYTATFTATSVGTATVTATINGATLFDDAQITVTAGAATQIALNAGNAQSATSGSAVAIAPSAIVRDAANNPVSGIDVRFTTTGGGGTLSPVSPATVQTGVDGVATLTSWTLGTIAGANTINVDAPTNVLTGENFTITATGTVGAVSVAQTTITPSAGSVTAGTPATITVQLKDANTNNVTSSGGTVALTTTLGSLSSVTNNNDGTYTATLSTSASGTATVTGTINGVAITDNAVVTVTVGAAATATSTVTAGSTSITANGASTSTITVQLKDAQGNNLTAGGATVVISTTAGTFTGATVDVGNGSYTRVLQSATSTATATLTATLTGNPITDDATVTFVAGAADRTVSTITSSPASPATVTVGTAVTITVQLKDANGNNLTASGGTVVISRSGTGSLTSTTNNGDGTYTATLNSSVVGSATVSATLGGLGITTGNPSVTFQAGAATQIAVNAGNNQSATAGSTLSTPPSVVVRDANGNPVNGVDVTFTVSTGGGAIVPASVATATTNSSGIAALTSWTLGATAGSNTLTVAAPNDVLTGEPLTFTATGTVGAASVSTSTITATDLTRTAGQSTTITVQLIDANNNNLTSTGGTVALSTNIGSLGVVTDNGNGTYSATFTASTAGTATITGTVNGAGIVDNATVTVTAAAESQFTINAGNGQTANAGSAVAIAPSVLVRDASSNPVSGVNVTFTTTGGSGTLSPVSPATVPTGVNGIAALTSWTLGNTAGANTVQAQVTSGALTGSIQNFSATGIAGAASTATSTITAGAGSFTAGSSVLITVQLKDALSNNLTAGGNSVTLATTLGSLSSVTNNGNGTYTATLSSTVSGSATVTGTITGSAITDNEVVTVNVGAANAAQSTASVPAGTAGAVTTITVQAKDANGNNRTTTSGTVAAAVTGANAGATVNVVNNANGTYTLTYTPTVSGTDAIAITLDNGTPTAIGGSPYSSVVSASTLTNYLVEAGGGGAIPTQTAGASFSIRLTARDASGNTVTAFSGGANTVDLTSTGTLVGGPTITTTAFINGVLTRSVTITNTGSFTITATQTVGGTPSTASASFTVSPAGASGATTLITPSAGSVTAGTPATITVQAKDANSNNLTTSGGTVTLATDLGTLSGVTNNNNGTYTATLSTSASGTATVTGTINGVAITDNAVVTVTVGAAATATSTVTAGSTSITANGATTSTITVQLKDAQGNNLTTGGATVVISTTAGTFTGATVDVGNGTYTRVLQSATSTATATLTATLAGNPITDDATVTFVAGAATTAQSTISVSSNSVTVGTAVTITVQLKDMNNNNLATSGGTVVISRSGTGSLTSTTNNNDGTYTATINSAVIGSATISATLAGNPITSGDQTVAFTAGAATQISLYAGNGQSAAAGTAVAIAPAAVVRDANGNPVANIDVRFTTTVGAGTLSPVSPATVQTDANGVAALTSWTLDATAGTNTISVDAPSNVLTGENFTITATGTVGAASAATTLITPSAGSVTAGAPATITVQAKDAGGNNLTTSGGTVTLATTLGSLSAVTNNNNGTYTATLSTSASGTATVTGTINGVAITDNAVVTVNVGVAATATSTVTAGSATLTANGIVNTTITVQLKDAQGNNLTTGGATVTLTRTGTGALSSTAGGSPPASVTMDDPSNGTYTATLTAPSALGSATLNATITGPGAIADDAVVTFVAGAATTTQSTIAVTSNSVTVGTAVTVTVQLKDANSNNLAISGGTVVISRSGTGSLTSTTNNNDGTYTATLNSAVIGSAVISATLNASPITSGNQTVTFTAGAATQIAVNAGDNQSAAAGTTLPTPPSVVVRDANGNPVNGVNVDFLLASGGGTIVPAGSPSTIATNSAGIAALTSWTLGATAGSNTVTATSGSLTGSPITFTATGTVGAASPATSTVSTNFAARVSGLAATITVQLIDANNNNLTASGGTVTLATNIGTLGAVTNNTNGTYTATYTATTAGLATITGTINGAAIADNATITVTAGAATQIAIVAGDGQTATAGSAVAIAPRVLVRDAAANPVAGVNVDFEATAGNGIIVPPSIATIATDGDGYATLTSWTLNSTTGLNSLTATATGLSGSPLTFTATGVAGAAFTGSTLITAGAASFTAGSSVLITVQLKDNGGNNLTTGPVSVTLSTTAGTLSSVANVGNGTYTATLSGTVIGNATVSGAINGDPIADNEVVNVTAGAPSPAQSTAVAPAGTAGTLSTTTMTVTDAFGNSRFTNSGVTGTSAVVTGANAGAVVTTQDNGDGTYYVKYTPFTAGLDFITIQVNTGAGLTAISGSPFQSVVSAGALDHFSVENFGGGGIPTQKAGTSFKIRVVAHDVYDNVVTSFNTMSSTVDISSTGTLSQGLGTSTNFVSGVLASLDVTFSDDGEFTITATKTGGGPSGVSNAFTVLGIPVVTAATAVGDENFTANWDAFTDATSYRLDVSVANDFSSFVTGYQNKVVSGTSSAVTGLNANTVYFYRVRASVGGIITSSAIPTNLTTLAADGSGSADIAPTTVTAGSDTTLTMTYTAAGAGGMSAGGTITMVVPANWSAPQTTTNNAAGYTRVSVNGGGATTTGLVVTGSGPWLVTYTLASALSTAQTVAIVYGDATLDPAGAAAVPGTNLAGDFNFDVQQKSSSSGTLTTVSGTQTVTVDPDGSGTANIAPTTATSNTPTTHVLTYTVPTGGMLSGGQITMVVPATWTAPQTADGNNPGFVQANIASGGYATTDVSVSLTGPWLITVTLPSDLNANDTVLIRYGDTSVNVAGAATAPNDVSPTPYVFQVQQKATGAGTLKNVVGNQTVTVSP